jgi:hypothetical protein
VINSRWISTDPSSLMLAARAARLSSPRPQVSDKRFTGLALAKWSHDPQRRNELLVRVPLLGHFHVRVIHRDYCVFERQHLFCAFSWSLPVAIENGGVEAPATDHRFSLLACAANRCRLRFLIDRHRFMRPDPL